MDKIVIRQKRKRRDERSEEGSIENEPPANILADTEQVTTAGMNDIPTDPSEVSSTSNSSSSSGTTRCG